MLRALHLLCLPGTESDTGKLKLVLLSCFSLPYTAKTSSGKSLVVRVENDYS